MHWTDRLAIAASVASAGSLNKPYVYLHDNQVYII